MGPRPLFSKARGVDGSMARLLNHCLSPGMWSLKVLWSYCPREPPAHLCLCHPARGRQPSSDNGNFSHHLSPKVLQGNAENVCRNSVIYIRKEVRQGWILSLCLFNFYAEYIMWNAGLDEAEAGIKIARRNINNLRYADGTTLMAESKEELKSLLMKVKEESEKFGLNSTFRKLRSWHLVPSLHRK